MIYTVQCRFCRRIFVDGDSDSCPECGKGRMNDWAIVLEGVKE